MRTGRLRRKGRRISFTLPVALEDAQKTMIYQFVWGLVTRDGCKTVPAKLAGDRVVLEGELVPLMMVQQERRFIEKVDR